MDEAPVASAMKDMVTLRKCCSKKSLEKNVAMQHNQDESARLFLDLWQDQMSQLMKDERYVNGMLDMLQKMQQGMMHTASPFWPETVPSSPDAANPTVAQASSAAPDADTGKLALLTQRLALCERRIAELESLIVSIRSGNG